MTAASIAAPRESSEREKIRTAAEILAFPDGEPEAGNAAPTSVQILLVEDEVDEAALLAALLEKWGHSVTTVCDGAAALAHIASARPDMVLLDIGLPTMDGFEVARRARANDPGGRLFLVAVTGYADEADARTALAVGFDEFLVKPIELTALRSLIARLGQQLARAHASDAGAVP
jgi:CheY-like chemotaxis protein